MSNGQPEQVEIQAAAQFQAIRFYKLLVGQVFSITPDGEEFVKQEPMSIEAQEEGHGPRIVNYRSADPDNSFQGYLRSAAAVYIRK